MIAPEVKLLYVEKDERALSYQRRKTQHEERERSLQASIKQWSEDIIPNWKNDEAIGNKKIRSLCAKGIPTDLRSQIWSLLIGNRIVISQEIYNDYLKLAEKVYKEQKEIALNVDNNNNCNNTKNELYSKHKKRIASIILIENDQRRTFPNLDFFHNSRDQSRLLRILKVYACCRPDMGYVQGMSHVVGLLLLILGSELETFTCFLNLMDSRNNVQFYQLDRYTISRYTKTFDYFFQLHLPDLYAYFSEIGITSEMFLLDWNLTLFCKTLPLEAAVRFWDSFLCEGEVYIVRTAIGLLSLYKDELLEKELEEIGRFLSNFPRDVDVEAMANSISKVSITGQKFESIYNSRRIDSEGVQDSTKTSSTSIFDEYMNMSMNMSFDMKGIDLDRLKFWRRGSSTNNSPIKNSNSNSPNENSTPEKSNVETKSETPSPTKSTTNIIQSLFSFQFSSDKYNVETKLETSSPTKSTTSTVNDDNDDDNHNGNNNDNDDDDGTDMNMVTETDDEIIMNDNVDINIEINRKKGRQCILS